MINYPDLCWLAGWLEGEGSFISRPPRPSRAASINISAVSTDHDTIERAATLLGARVHGPYQTSGKPIWRVELSQRYLVLEMGERLYPLMGVRRRAAIDAQWQLAAAHPPRRRREAVHGTWSRYTNNRCRCGACRNAARAYNREYRSRKKATA